jgi:hypothetical protein
MQYVDQEQKIERYILNQMDEEEACDFEALFLSDPECLEQLEIAEKLHLGLKLVAAPERAVVDKVKPFEQPDIADRWWLRKMPVWATAALLLVTLLPSRIFYQQIQEHNMPQLALSVISLSLSTTRSSQVTTTKVKKNQGRTILSIYVDTEVYGMFYANYGLAIGQQNDLSFNWKTSGLHLDANDILYIDLGTGFLQQGTYDYEIFGLTDQGISQKIGAGKFLVSD